MPSNYFGGAPNSFMGGAAYADQLRAQEYEERALRSMIERFGPEAADPVRYGQLEGIRQRQELHPYDVATAQRSGAAMDAAVGRHGAIAGDPTAVGIDTQITGDKRAQENEQRSRMQAAGSRAALYLRETQRRGGNIGEAFDRVAGILPKLGFDAESLPAIREQITSSPEAAEQFIAMMSGGEGGVRASASPIPVYDESGRLRLMQPMSDGSMSMIEGVTPASALQAEERLNQGWGRLDQTARRISLQELEQMGYDATPGHQYYMVQTADGGMRIVSDVIPGTEQEMKRETQTAERLGELSESIQGAEATVLAPAAAVRANGERALSMIRGSDWFKSGGVVGSVARTGGRLLPGTEPWEITQMLETLKANIGFSQLSNMTRGLGAVSERELQQLESVLGRLEVNRRPDLLQADIQEVLRLHANIVEKTQAALERRRGEIGRIQTTRDAEYGPPAPQPRTGSAPRTAPRAAPPPATGEPTIDELLEMYQ